MNWPELANGMDRQAACAPGQAARTLGSLSSTLASPSIVTGPDAITQPRWARPKAWLAFCSTRRTVVPQP
jgi:hypothetical protein